MNNLNNELLEKQILKQIETINLSINTFKENVILSNNAEFTSNMIIVNEMAKQKSTLIKEYVMLKHINANGTQKEISFVKEKNGRTYYRTCINRKSIKAKTEDDMYELLYSYYYNGIDYTFGKLFEKALEEKSFKTNAKNEINSSNTIYKNQKDYNRYISDDFASVDIRKMDKKYIDTYVITRIEYLNNKLGHKLSLKAFRSFKGILNLVFSYAEREGICINFIGNKNQFVDNDFKKYLDSSVKKAEYKAFTPNQIDTMTSIIEDRIQKDNCYTNGFIFLLAKETGMRVGELVALKWSDLDFENDRIHIHTQQLKKQGTNDYEYVLWTKNEKGVSEDGRYFPITDSIRHILFRLKNCQSKVGISSEWVFANENNEWIKADTQYEKFLMRLCNSLNYDITNNHAIRMYFNSYILIPNGITVNNRAKLLGHSVEVNLKYYTFEDTDYCDNTKDILNGATSGNKNTIQFPKSKTLKAFI